MGEYAQAVRSVAKAVSIYFNTASLFLRFKFASAVFLFCDYLLVLNFSGNVCRNKLCLLAFCAFNGLIILLVFKMFLVCSLVINMALLSAASLNGCLEYMCCLALLFSS